MTLSSARIAASIRSSRRSKVAAAGKARPDLIERAREAARKAYAEGRKAPAQDPAAMTLIEEARTAIDGTALAILEAWTDEFHNTHLNAVGLK